MCVFTGKWEDVLFIKYKYVDPIHHPLVPGVLTLSDNLALMLMVVNLANTQ